MSEPSTNEPPEVQYLINSYRDWVTGEGVPLHADFSVDLRNAEVAPWSRLGVNGAVINVAGRGDFLDLWLLELPAGGSSTPQRHLFEAVAYVISGHGSTTIEAGDATHSFEWGPRSMFAIPLNARYQFFNASGQERPRIALTTSFPIMMNLLHNAEFIFGVDYEFPERAAGDVSHFRGGGTTRLVHEHDHERFRNFWETNFVPDLGVFAELKPFERRGKGSNNVQFLMADGVIHGHMSEIPAGRYKKGHRHLGGTHIYPVTGEGYSLLWYEGETTRRRVDWCHGFVYAPPDLMYHQHFNVGSEPARYFALKMGNYRYPVLSRMNDQMTASGAKLRETKSQIEYEDEPAEIRELYTEELQKRGLPESWD